MTSSNINYEIFINLIILFEIWYIVQNRSLWRNTSNCSISLCYNQIISLYIMFIRPSVYTEIFVAILRRTDGQQFNHQFASNFMIYDLLSDKLLLSRKITLYFTFRIRVFPLYFYTELFFKRKSIKYKNGHDHRAPLNW